MNRLIIIIFLTLSTATSGFGQNNFIIIDIIEQNGFGENSLKVAPRNIFEDRLYIVSKTSSGEWKEQ